MLFVRNEEHYRYPRAFISIVYKQRVALGITAKVAGVPNEIIRYHDQCSEEVEWMPEDTYVLHRVTEGQLNQILRVNGLMMRYTKPITNGLIQACIAAARIEN